MALGFFVSCSKDEVVKVNKHEITFGEVFVDNATKATDPSYGASNALTSFKVWGTVNNTQGNPVSIFNNNTVTGTVGENSVWNSTEVTQYWIAGAKYNFAAVVNASEVVVGTDLLPEKIKFDSNGSTDLLYAKSKEYTGKVSDNDKVELSFSHLLSKIKFTVTNNSSTAAGYSFLVKNIKVNGLKTSGEYTVSTQKWAATNGDYTFSNIAVASKATSAESDVEQLIIPGEVTVSFTVDILYNGNTITSTNYSSGATKYALAAANAYNFNIDVAVGSMIQFTVTDQPSWTEVTPGININ